MTQNLSSIIKNFRYRVLVLQRFCSSWSAQRNARLQLWLLQLKRFETKGKLGKAGKDADVTVSDEVRMDVLKARMHQLRRELPSQREQYDLLMKEYLKLKKIEDAKRLIRDDGEPSELKMPKYPTIPSLLSKKELVACIQESKKRQREIDLETI